MHATLKPRYALAVLAIGTIALAACGDDSGILVGIHGRGGIDISGRDISGSDLGDDSRGDLSGVDHGCGIGRAQRSRWPTTPRIGQQILVNSAGMTIYLFVPDGTATTSAVPAGDQGQLAACGRRRHAGRRGWHRCVEAGRRPAARRHDAGHVQRPPALHVPERRRSWRRQGAGARRRLVRGVARRRSGGLTYQPD